MPWFHGREAYGDESTVHVLRHIVNKLNHKDEIPKVTFASPNEKGFDVVAISQKQEIEDIVVIEDVVAIPLVIEIEDIVAIPVVSEIDVQV